MIERRPTPHRVIATRIRDGKEVPAYEGAQPRKRQSDFDRERAETRQDTASR